jgi:hypothetical protein
MPRATSYGGEELHLRRLARRSANKLLLDDDFVAPEVDWAESTVARPSERDLDQWYMALGSDDIKDQ